MVKYILFYGIGFGMMSMLLFWCLAWLSLDFVMLLLAFSLPGLILGTGYGVVVALRGDQGGAGKEQ